MLKFMRKIPGGMLLIPMLISALVNTLAPGFFANFGGLTETFLTAKGTNYIVALVCFCSATLLDVRSLGKVLKKQGTMLILKVLICLALATLFVKTIGLPGFMGISAIAFTVAICSINPSLYLALVTEYGSENDKGAFGLTGLLCVPAFPIFVFSISQGGGIDWIPIISTLIPIFFGLIVGNLDKDLGKMFGGLLGPLTPFMGWSFGAGINLFEAIQAGPQGIIVTAIFYIAMLPAILFFETKVLKENGISTFGMSSIAGMSVSVPSIMAFNNPDLVPFAASATAQIAFGVVLTSIITPILAQRFAKRKGLEKPKHIPQESA